MSWRTTSAPRRGRNPAPARGPLARIFDVLLAAAILFLFALVVARVDRIATNQLAGAPVVNDGDTITLDGERIRLLGIDAPELGQTCRDRSGEVYACGRRAREELVRLAGERTVRCSGWDRDRYGRLLATCSAGSLDLNRELVQQGWAVSYGDYADAEAAARGQGLGLWAGTFDRPREWRNRHGGMAEVEHDLYRRIIGWLAGWFGFS